MAALRSASRPAWVYTVGIRSRATTSPIASAGGLGQEQDRHFQSRLAQDHALFDQRDRE